MLTQENETKLDIEVTRAEGNKCPRCWKYHTVQGNYMDICDPCCVAIVQGWPDHEAVPFIKGAYRAQVEKYQAK